MTTDGAQLVIAFVAFGRPSEQSLTSPAELFAARPIDWCWVQQIVLLSAIALGIIGVRSLPLTPNEDFGQN